MMTQGEELKHVGEMVEVHKALTDLACRMRDVNAYATQHIIDLEKHQQALENAFNGWSRQIGKVLINIQSKISVLEASK
jgi:hypothetical protein